MLCLLLQYIIEYLTFLNYCSGTAKQHVTNDYEETLAAAIESCHVCIFLLIQTFRVSLNVRRKNDKQNYKEYWTLADWKSIIDSMYVKMLNKKNICVF